MSSFKNFEVKKRTNGCGEFGIYRIGMDWSWMASLKREDQANRLSEMLNDTAVNNLSDHHTNDSDENNYRIAQTTKLFLLQEGLTWFDLGFDKESIRNINKFLEMPLDLRQAS